MQPPTALREELSPGQQQQGQGQAQQALGAVGSGAAPGGGGHRGAREKLSTLRAGPGAAHGERIVFQLMP